MALLSQRRTAAAQCGLFTHKSVPDIFEPPCNSVPSTPVTKRPKTTIDVNFVFSVGFRHFFPFICIYFWTSRSSV